MRTRFSSNLPVVSPSNPSTLNPKRRNHRCSKQPFILEEFPIDTMADQRIMAELLCAPTEGYAKAIVVPLILAEQFELKHSLINMMTSDQFFRLEKDNPHDHIRWFNKITSTIKYKDVPNSSIKLMLFPFSLAGVARRWLEKEPSRSIHTWEDLVSKFINEFFPPSRTTNLRNEISNFQQRDSQTYSCGQSANECCNYRHDGYSQQFQATPPPASVKAVEETCVTCGDVHPYYQCLAAGGNTFPELQDNIHGYILAAAVNYNQGNSIYRPPEQSYQTPTQQNQNVPINELEKVKRMNEANMKAMLTQINMVKNKLRNEMKNSIQASLSNQTNKIKNMMASLFQMNTVSTSGSGSLPSKGKFKAINARSGHVVDGPTVPTPPPFINPKEDERVEETLTDLNLVECTIKVPHPPVQKYKPPSQRDYVVHQRDPVHPNIPYPSRMLKQKQQEKDEVQVHKFWQMFKQLHINITLADALIIMPKYQKLLKALMSNKEKLQEQANTPLNENFSAVILKKLPKKLGDCGKFLIPCGFSELNCKALADLGSSINLMPLFVWKKLGLPELISTRMTFELANRAICTPDGIARDVFIPVGKFTFPADFIIVDYESNPRVPFILGRPFLRTVHALIDVHGEEMILQSNNLINVFNDSSDDFIEDLFSIQPSGNPTFSSHPELTSLKVKDDIFDPEGGNVPLEKLLDLDSIKDLHPPLHVNPLSGSTTYSSSPNPLLEELADELALITFSPKYDYDPQFNDDDFLEVESDTKNVYDDPFYSKGEKIKESKLLIDELDLLYDFLPSGYDSFIYQNFSRLDSLSSTNNDDKIFNLSILIQEKPFETITRVVQDKKLAISNASLVLEDFDPPFDEPFFFK
nr:hypothetical protein [Tanacetum cinerariifolium]